MTRQGRASAQSTEAPSSEKADEADTDAAGKTAKPSTQTPEPQAPGTVRSQFDSLDENGDGRVGSSEWGFTREEFQSLDKDRDGALTPDEYKGGRDERDYDGRFTGQDLNKDGKLARTEWNYGDESFKAADKDGNGTLTSDEFFGDVDPRDKDGQFGSLDQNRDKKITASEWSFGPESFQQADLNGDGTISDEEFFSQADVPAGQPMVPPRRR